MRDTSGATLFDWHAPASTNPTLQRQAVEPVRTMVESIPGAATPKTLGEARVQLVQAAPERSSALSELLFDARQAEFLRTLYLAAALAALGGWAAAVFGWRAGRRIERPLGALIRSADRIAHGDYTRPLDVLRRDELGDLQQALERMRGKLRQTTINKDYLYSVLNSMTDAVFVTSPDGVIKMANSASRCV